MPPEAHFDMGRGDGRRVEDLRGGAYRVTSRHGVAPPVRLLLESLPERAPRTALVGHENEGLLPAFARWLWPDCPLSTHEVDAYVAAKIRRGLERAGIEDVPLAVTADLPESPDGGGWSLIALAPPPQQEGQLLRDWIEQAHDRLAPDGRFLLASRAGQDPREEVGKVFGKVDLQAHQKRQGTVLSARRTKSASRTRERRHTVTCEHRGRTLAIDTRPGVFVYGRLDPGTKALLTRLQTEEGERILDLGCGTGVLGIAAALDANDPAPVLVDSNARAVDLARHNAEANGLPQARALLRADGEDLGDHPFDLALCNPPYFGDGRIARSLIATAARTLDPKGRLLLVAKDVRRHGELLEEAFEKVWHRSVLGYTVFEARLAFEMAEAPPEAPDRDS